MPAVIRGTAPRGWLPLLAILAACGDPADVEHRLSGTTMGTTFHVSVVAGVDIDAETLGAQILARLDEIDRLMSTYRQDAELATINRSGSMDWIPVSDRLCRALEHALQLGTSTGGAFDITVGPLVNLWGFGPGSARNEPPADQAIERARAKSGRDKLDVDCQRPALHKRHAELQIDLSGYAKGLAVDEVAGVLDDFGITNYLVEIGGDLRSRGRNARNNDWRIAIEMPHSGGRSVERVIHLRSLGVATSGDYRNFFDYGGSRYSHTIDPRTGRPVAHNLVSVTVLAESAAFADAMATALLVLGPDAGPEFAQRQNIAALFLIRNGGELDPLESPAFKLLTTN